MASARGKRIEAARKRVDARRAALGPYGDRPTARDRAIKRHAQWSGGPKTDKTGTRVVFYPDSEIFNETTYSFETIDERLRELAYLNSGIKIKLLVTYYALNFI